MPTNENKETTQAKGLSKKTWTIIAVVGLVVLLWLLGWVVKKNNTYKEWHDTFKSMDGSFSVDYPRTWEVQIWNRGAIEATFVNKEQVQVDWKYSYIHISKWVIWSANVEDAYAEAMQKYSNLFKKMEIVSEQSLKVDSTPAKMVVFNGTLGGKDMSYAIVVFVKDGVTYVGTATGEPNAYKELQQQLNGMLSSWKFTGTPKNEAGSNVSWWVESTQMDTWAIEQSGENVEMPVTENVSGDAN